MSILKGMNLFGYNKERIERTFDRMSENNQDFTNCFGLATDDFLTLISTECYNPKIREICDKFAQRCNSILKEYKLIWNNLSTEISETARKYAQEMNAELPNRLDSKIGGGDNIVTNSVRDKDAEGNIYIDKQATLQKLESLESIYQNTSRILDELVGIVTLSGFVNESIIRHQIKEIQEFQNDIETFLKTTNKELKENIEKVTTAVSSVTMGDIYTNTVQGGSGTADFGPSQGSSSRVQD